MGGGARGPRAEAASTGPEVEVVRKPQLGGEAPAAAEAPAAGEAKPE